MKTTSDDAVLFRTFHAVVPEEVREELYKDILKMSLDKDYDFERLVVKVLALVAGGKIPPSVGAVCRDLLALVLHSLTLSKFARDGRTGADVAGAVSVALKDAKRQLKQLERDADVQPTLTMADLERRAETTRLMVLDNDGGE